MSKRQRFIVTSAVLSLGFVGIALLEDRFRFLGIGGLGLLTILLFAWSLREGLGKNLTLLTFILPVFFTVGVGLFWFLLPTSIIARVPIVILYGLGIYTLCLTSNIYIVAAIRTIALLRAARGVGFVLTLVTFFLVFDAVLSIKANIFLTAGLIALLSYPLYLQGFWSVLLEKKLSREVLSQAIIASVIMGEIAFSMYFWPVTVVATSCLGSDRHDLRVDCLNKPLVSICCLDC